MSKDATFIWCKLKSVKSRLQSVRAVVSFLPDSTVLK